MAFVGRVCKRSFFLRSFLGPRRSRAVFFRLTRGLLSLSAKLGRTERLHRAICTRPWREKNKPAQSLLSSRRSFCQIPSASRVKNHDLLVPAVQMALSRPAAAFSASKTRNHSLRAHRLLELLEGRAARTRSTGSSTGREPSRPPAGSSDALARLDARTASPTRSGRALLPANAGCTRDERTTRREGYSQNSTARPPHPAQVVEGWCADWRSSPSAPRRSSRPSRRARGGRR